MNPTDEELLHAFYNAAATDTAALQQLADRLDSALGQIAYQILVVRTGSALQALDEWDIDDRLHGMWTNVLSTRQTGLARWPYQRLTALTWIVHLLCLEMDRHLGFRGPF
jgi:hypothetical protein